MERIIIIGGGHSGLEAANIITKMGGLVILITNNIYNIGDLSCNPSMGGIGKSNLIKEVDSLGGFIGYGSTKCSMQLKNINTSKGESVNCIRSQICRRKYKFLSQKFIKNNKKIKIIQDRVDKIIIKENKVRGVKTKNNIYKSNIVLITAGTFLNGKINIGLKKYKGGRINELGSNILSDQLKSFIKSYRLKTGTPPRIFSKNINWKNMKIQKGDYNPIPTLSS